MLSGAVTVVSQAELFISSNVKILVLYAPPYTRLQNSFRTQQLLTNGDVAASFSNQLPNQSLNYLIFASANALRASALAGTTKPHPVST